MAAPGADNFADAPVLQLGDVSITPLDGLTLDAEDPDAGGYRQSAWWAFTATKSGYVHLSLSGSSSSLDDNMAMGVFIGTERATLTPIQYNVDFIPNIRMQVVRGREYRVQVGTYGITAGAEYRLSLFEYLLSDQPQATPLGIPTFATERPTHIRVSPDGMRFAGLTSVNDNYDGGVGVWDLTFPEATQVTRFQLSPYRTGQTSSGAGGNLMLRWSADGTKLVVCDRVNISVIDVATGATSYATIASDRGIVDIRALGAGWIAVGTGTGGLRFKVSIGADGSVTWTPLANGSWFSALSITDEDFIGKQGSSLQYTRFDGSVDVQFSFLSAVGDPGYDLTYYSDSQDTPVRQGTVIWLVATDDATGTPYLAYVDVAAQTGGKIDVSSQLTKHGSSSYFAGTFGLADGVMGVQYVSDGNKRAVVAKVDVTNPAAPVISDHCYLSDGLKTAAPRYAREGGFALRDGYPYVYVNRVEEDASAAPDRNRWYVTNLPDEQPGPIYSALKATRRRFV